MERRAASSSLSQKERKKLAQELAVLMNSALEKKFKRELEQAVGEIEKIVLTEDIYIPLKMRAIIKELTEESIIDIPIERLLRKGESGSSERSLSVIEKVKEIKKYYKLSLEELARMLGVSQRTVNYWLQGEITPRLLAQQRISEVYEVHRKIIKAVKPHALRKWLFTPNKTLGDSIYNLLMRGKFERVHAYIEAFKEGVYI